jgi:hypothetical protein
MKYKLTDKSILLVNVFVTLVFLGIALSYFGVTWLNQQMGSITMIVLMLFLGLEAGVLKLLKKPPAVTQNTYSLWFLAGVFVLLALVVVPPLANMTVIGGEAAGIIVTLGALLSILLAFRE